MVDTGSDLNLINRDCYEKIGRSKIKDPICFDGIGASNNKTCGSFKTNIKIDNEAFKITFHVVDDNIMKHAVLIDNDFLNLVDFQSVQDEVTISKITQELLNLSFLEVLRIDTIEEVASIDLSHISDKDVTHIARNIT